MNFKLLDSILFALLATQVPPVNSRIIPASVRCLELDFPGPCLNKTNHPGVPVIHIPISSEIISSDVHRRAGGRPRPRPKEGDFGAGGDGSGGGTTGSQRAGTVGETDGSQARTGGSSDDQGGGKVSGGLTTTTPEPAPGPDPKTQPGRSNRAGEGALVVQNSRALATLERWKCGKTKRTSLFDRLFRRAFTSADAEDPAKYLEWLENMALDDNGNKFPRDKIVFYTGGTLVMADSFLNTNPEYHSFFGIFGSDSFSKYWKEVESTLAQDAAKSQALAKYARNPLVFGATKTISSTDTSYWAKHEWPYMQDAGTITKLKDNAQSPTEVDYEIAPPEKKC